VCPDDADASQRTSLALSFRFCVNINSQDLREGLSNSKLELFCNVVHPSYGQGRQERAMAPDEHVFRCLVRFDVVTV
jgi:hypothetical protein